MNTTTDHPTYGSKPGQLSRLAPIWIGWHFFCITLLQLSVMGRASQVLGEEFAEFLLLYAVENVALTFTLLGLHVTAMRFLSIHRTQGRHRACLLIMARCFGVRGGLLLIVVAALYPFLRYGPSDIDVPTAAVVCIVTALHGMMLLQHACLQGLGRYGRLAGGSSFMLVGALVPAHDLKSVFLMFAIGFGVSVLINALSLGTYRGDREYLTALDPTADTGLVHLVRFSAVLSLGGVFAIGADNSGILLLKQAYPLPIYSVVALSLSLVQYPARLNALSDALMLPQISSALHAEGKQGAVELFQSWVRILHLAGLVLVPLLIVIAGPFVRWLFAPELEIAIPLLSLLLVGLLARFVMPINLAVLIGSGRPGLTVLLNGGKLAVDVIIALTLGGGEPMLLIVALLGSFLLHTQASYLLAARQLDLPIRPYWPLVGTVFAGAFLLLCNQWAITSGALKPFIGPLFGIITIGAITYSIIFGRHLLAKVL